MQISISKHVWLKWDDYLKKSSLMDFFREKKFKDMRHRVFIKNYLYLY